METFFINEHIQIKVVQSVMNIDADPITSSHNQSSIEQSLGLENNHTKNSPSQSQNYKANREIFQPKQLRRRTGRKSGRGKDCRKCFWVSEP